MSDMPTPMYEAASGSATDSLQRHLQLHATSTNRNDAAIGEFATGRRNLRPVVVRRVRRACNWANDPRACHHIIAHNLELFVGRELCVVIREALLEDRFAQSR